MSSIPDEMRRAMEAAGVDVDAVEHDATLAAVIPSDEEEQERQASIDMLAKTRAKGLQCSECGDDADPRDPNFLREVTGWSRSREQGGQNHVIARRETGRFLCGTCSVRMRAGLDPEQGSLL